MALSETKRNQIAWHYLLHRARGFKVEELSVERFRDRFQTMLRGGIEEHQDFCNGASWDFCNDLLDAILFTIQRPQGSFFDYEPKLDGLVEFRLSDERRLAIGYIFFLYSVKEEGIRIGKNTKRDVNSRAVGLGVDPEEAQAFFKEMAKDLLHIALN